MNEKIYFYFFCDKMILCIFESSIIAQLMEFSKMKYSDLFMFQYNEEFLFLNFFKLFKSLFFV